MSKLIEYIKQLPDFFAKGKVSLNDIIALENELGVSLADDFKECLLEFGLFQSFGHEFTGVCESKRLNVASVTKKFMDRNYAIANMYVIEDTCMDGCIICQDSEGLIYMVFPNQPPRKINDCFLDYIRE